MNTKHKLYAKYVLSFFTIILLGIFAHPDNVLADTIIVGSTIDVDTTWTSNNIYVIQDDSLTILQSITLTIEPGTIVKIHGDGPGGGIIGQAPDQKNFFVEGTLVADGTSANPIYFTSLRDDTIGGDTNGDGGATTPQAGNWGRIVFATTSSGSILDNVVIRYAGAVDDSPTGNVGPTYYGAIILEDSALAISDATIAHNALHGVHLKGTASIDFDGCNNIFANNDYGLLNESDNYANAPNNWWGDENGPFHPTLNPQGQGNAASDDVGFTPWRTSPCGELGVSHLYLPIVLR